MDCSITEKKKLFNLKKKYENHDVYTLKPILCNNHWKQNRVSKS